MERTFTEDHSLDRCGRSVPHLPRRLFQGAIVPMYTIIVREYFSPQEAGMRVGVVVGATLLGMASWAVGCPGQSSTSLALIAPVTSEN